MKILIVEDDPNLGQSLGDYLGTEKMTTVLSETIADARARLKIELPDLVILDWMLPDGQGIDFLRELRVQNVLIPVILLTSRNDLIDKVVGLESGANDYLTKPFEPRELVARIRAHLRGSQTRPSPTLNVGPIRLDFDSRQAYLDGRPVVTTKMEFMLLKLFCENPGKVFTRDDLLNKVWGFERYPTTRTVDTHVLQLRQKFGEELFETLRGVGYRLKN
jgi:DNA-binding response OmpR family regulator